MAISFLNPFLIFITLLITSSITTFTSAKPDGMITEQLIDKICRHTRNPSLCLQTLTPLKAHPLPPNPVSTLGSKPINLAQTQERRIRTTIWTLHEKIKDNTVNPHLIQQKQRYYKCHVKFSDVNRRLTEAKMAMQEGNAASVKHYTSMAMNQAGSCEAEFANPPREPSNVAQDIGTFRDVCSVILAICDEVVRTPPFGV